MHFVRRLFAVSILLLVAAVLSATGTTEEPSAVEVEPATLGEEGWSNPLVKEETDDFLIVVDSLGNEVRVTKRPQRPLINHTSILGVWYVAGGTSIARPQASAGFPAAATDLPLTGRVSSPNPEVIVALEPDFVVLSGSMGSHQALSEVLVGNGTETLMVSYDNYVDFENILDLFARIVDNADVVNTVVPGIRTSVSNVWSRFEDEDPVKFLSLFASSRSVSAETNLAHTARMATLLGGENIVEEGTFGQGEKRVTLSMERILERDPDVVLITPMGSLDGVQDRMREDLESNEAWMALPAVQEGRVIYLPSEYFLYRPSDEWPEAFEFLGEVLYAE